MSVPRVVLASGSPRRRQLLEQMGLTFEVRPTDADETVPPGMAAEEAAELLARRKAGTAALRDPGALVVAADTLVTLDGRALGKPADGADAARMLKLLRGRSHVVVTGLCVAFRGGEYCASERTTVSFDEMSDRVIDEYVATGEPMDKAGAYGIQGRAGVYIRGIEGCYYNVMGLPLALLRKLIIRAVGEEEYGRMVSWGTMGKG